MITDCGTWTTTPPDCVTGTTQKFNNTLASLNTSGSPLALGAYAGGDKHRYQLTVSLPSNAGNEYQAGNSTTDLNWSATQS